MAQQMIINSRLTLTFETGMTAEGKPIYKAKSYANVKTDATADQLQQAGLALAGLSVNPLITVERTDNYNII